MATTAKSVENGVEEKRQPHAFALAVDADQIHAVVPVAGPHQRQPMLTHAQAVFDGPHAVLVERSHSPPSGPGSS